MRPLDKNYIDETNHLADIITDLLSSAFQIEHFVGDNPKRAWAKFVLNHASLFPCEYCFCQGSSMLISAEGKSKRRKIVWPASSKNAESKTAEKVLEIIMKIEENPALSKFEKKGVVGRSPLFDIPCFDFVRDAPAEYMHAVCIGVVKRLLLLTFDIGVKRPTASKTKLLSPQVFNECMSETKVFRECSRRSRKLDMAVMKAQELRNIILFFFPHVLQCMPPNAKERKLWVLLAFLIRACILPKKEFSPIDLNEIEQASREFYTLYENHFGQVNCSYNTHIVGCHLIEMRAHGPLTLTSAFGFENFYGEMRHAFAPGTQSTLKQIFQKILLKRVISYHCCENSIFFSDNDSPSECNSLIYVFKHNDHKMYKIIKNEKHHVLCYPQGKFKFSFREASDLNWSGIGVYKKGGLNETPTIINKTEICGKVLPVGEFLITCPNEVLREK